MVTTNVLNVYLIEKQGGFLF